MLTFLFLNSCNEAASPQLVVNRTESQEEIIDWSVEASLDNVPPEADFQYFARISLDLRSKRPSMEELQAYEQSPAKLEQFIDQWLNDPAFPKQIAWYWNDAIHTAIWASQVDVWSIPPFETRQALGWEPLAFVEAIVRDDLPFQNLVTIDQMPTNEVIGQIWEMPGDENWSWADPADDRPMAGILSSRFLWVRYKVDFLNENRARANHFSRIFLCHDYLERDVDFSFEVLVDSIEDMDSAIQTVPACTSCHASLDPLASFFGAFQLSVNLDIAQSGGVSEFKTDWYNSFRSPNYFGKPGQNIYDLGQFVAQDPRFTQCSVQRVWEGLIHETPEKNSNFLSLVQEFEEQNSSVRSLVKSIVLSEQYRNQERHILRPEQLIGVLKDVLFMDEGTETEGIGPLIWSDKHRVLFGASNDYTIFQSNQSFTVGNHLILEWLSTPISKTIEIDLQRSPEQRDLILVNDENSEDQIREQIRTWGMQLLSYPIEREAPIVNQLFLLWEETAIQYGRTSAWTTVFMALLHHPDSVMR